MIKRSHLLITIRNSLKNFPVTAILGPRQCGKTTISRVIAESIKANIFDLEDPVDLERLTIAPKLTLEQLPGLVIIDEIQRLPELFPILRVLADRTSKDTKFLILGSASPELVKNASESLSGRISYIDMSGFSVNEISNDKDLWLRGGFPRSFLAKEESISFKWRIDFIRSLLERDIPQLGINIPSVALHRFWTMLAHYHGQIWNGSEFARSLSITEPTARKYLDILTGAYVVRQLQPWHENLKKRQVKSPKVYIRDSGILHALLSLNHDSVMNHPKLGASWEGFVIEQILTISMTRDYYFWATYTGAELDLLVFKSGKRFGFEIKYTDVPKITKSMKIAIEELKLDMLFIIYPGDKSYQVKSNITVLSINTLNDIPKFI